MNYGASDIRGQVAKTCRSAILVHYGIPGKLSPEDIVSNFVHIVYPLLKSHNRKAALTSY